MNNNMSAMEIAANLRKPIGEKGLKVAELMNKGNATFYNELYKSVNWEDGMRVLEIGTGNAKHIPEILSQANDIIFHIVVRPLRLLHSVLKEFFCSA